MVLLGSRRGGGGPDSPPCRGDGSTESCEDASDDAADEADDAEGADGPGDAGGSCTGTPTPCSEYGSIIPCDSQEGCGWDSRELVCRFTPIPCERYATAFGCERHDGCVWN
jgi:hypothetical protein